METGSLSSGCQHGQILSECAFPGLLVFSHGREREREEGREMGGEGERERGKERRRKISGVSSYKGTNPLIKAPPL